MKKIVLTLFVTTGICFSSILFLSGETKDPIDFGKIRKAFALIYESRDYESDGKTVKNERSVDEAKAILNSIFKKGSIISTTDNCYFIKKDCGYHFGQNMEFVLSCFQPEKTEYGINGLKNILVFDIDKNQTNKKIVEKFEDTHLFKGKIQITKDSYDLGSFPEIIEVNCKILSLSPVEIEKPDDLEVNTFNDNTNNQPDSSVEINKYLISSK